MRPELLYAGSLSETCQSYQVVRGHLLGPSVLPPQCRMVNSTDVVELELKSKRFSLSMRKKEAIAPPEAPPQVCYWVATATLPTVPGAGRESQYRDLRGGLGAWVCIVCIELWSQRRGRAGRWCTGQPY